jgi:hypothetical protein
MAKATFSALAGLAEAGLKLAPQKLDLSVTACLRPIPMAAMASVQASSVLFDATTDQTRHINVMKDHQQESQKFEASEEKTQGEGEEGSRVEG